MTDMGGGRGRASIDDLGPGCALHSFASGIHPREGGLHFGEALGRVPW
jgi:hypothetical protein